MFRRKKKDEPTDTPPAPEQAEHAEAVPEAPVVTVPLATVAVPLLPPAVELPVVSEALPELPEVVVPEPVVMERLWQTIAQFFKETL